MQISIVSQVFTRSIERVRRFAVVNAALLVCVLIGVWPMSVSAQQRQTGQGASTPDSSMPGATSLLGNSGKIKLPELPSIVITAVPSYGSVPLTVGFFANGVDPAGKGFVSYLWMFGDGGVSMAPPLMFFHTFRKPGTYVTTVTATTADGRFATAFAAITVRPELK